MIVRVSLIVMAMLTLIAGCSSSPHASPVASGCAPGLEGSDAAACWLWSDAMSRAASPDQTPGQPLLRGADGTVIVSGQSRR